MKKKDKTQMELRIVNTLAVLTTKAVTQTLFNYLSFVNVAVEDRPQINMKNEFHYILPATVTIVKVKLKTIQDIGPLASWPEVYERVMWLFENDPDVGDYVDDKGNKKKGKGINTIAIPETLDEVPKWILSIIDVETLVEDNMRLFLANFQTLRIVSRYGCWWY